MLRQPGSGCKAVEDADVAEVARGGPRSGVLPSHGSRITVSLLASSTRAETLSPSISTSITSPVAKPNRCCVHCVPSLSSCPSQQIRVGLIPSAYRRTCHIGTDGGRLYENFGASRAGEDVGQAVADLHREHRRALLQEARRRPRGRRRCGRATGCRASRPGALPSGDRHRASATASAGSARR